MSTFTVFLPFIYHSWKVDMSCITKGWILGMFTGTNWVDSLGMARNLPFQWLETSFLVSSYKYNTDINPSSCTKWSTYYAQHIFVVFLIIIILLTLLLLLFICSIQFFLCSQSEGWSVSQLVYTLPSLAFIIFFFYKRGKEKKKYFSSLVSSKSQLFTQSD